MIDHDSKGCRKCEFCKEINAFDGFSFLGCTCAPNKGKPCFDIKDEDCPKKRRPWRDSMTNEQAIEKAKSRLNMCDYQSEMLNNPWLSESYRMEGEWLRVVLRLAMQATDVCNHRAERTGRWVHDINNLYACSECYGRETMSPRKLKAFCPHCGAHMIGGEEHD